MVKRFLELIVFTVILAEIFMFAAHSTTGNASPSVAINGEPQQQIARNNSSPYTSTHKNGVLPSAYIISKVVDDRETLEGIAEDEATRMIQTGDTEAYLQQVEKNRPLLNIIAPGL